MKNDEKSKFLELMTSLSEIFDKSLSSGALNLYWQVLKEYSLDDIKRATNNIIQTHKYATFPKPAEFIEFINPPEDIEVKAEFALDEFWERFNNSGYDSFEWRDPILAMIVEHYGGWGMILDTFPRADLKDQNFWMKDFKKIYGMYVRFPKKHVQLRYIGFFKGDNKAKGFLTDKTGHPIPLPDGKGYVKIGSPEAQKLLGDEDIKQLTDGANQ